MQADLRERWYNFFELIFKKKELYFFLFPKGRHRHDTARQGAGMGVQVYTPFFVSIFYSFHNKSIKIT
jgi:hypothetical protein